MGGAPGGGSAAGLFDFELDPGFDLPVSFSFEQRDGVLAPAIAGGLTTQIGPWIDDLCVTAGTSLGTPDLVVANQPSFGQYINVGAPVIDTLTLRNEGTTVLTVSDIVSSDSHFSIVPAPSFPLMIPAGDTLSFDLEFDAGGDFGAFAADLTITSDDVFSTTEVVSVSASSFSDGDKLITPNFDFESAPFDDQWINSGGVVAGPALSGVGATGAYVVGGQSLNRDFVGTPDFEAQFFFAVDDTTDRQLNFYITNEAVGSGDGSPTVNLAYFSGGWNVYDGAQWQPLGQLNPVVGAPGAANVYLLKVVGRGWGSPGATYDVFLSDVGGTTFTSAVTDLTFSHEGSPEAGTPTAVRFRGDSGNNPGFWVDDLCVTVGAPAVDDPNLNVVSTPQYPVQLDDNSAIMADLVLENTGLNETLNITDITLGGANPSNFTVLTAFPVNILPGQQAPISIQFERGAAPAGTFTAIATVTSNDETTPLIDINIQASSLEDSGKIVENIDFEDTSGSPFASLEHHHRARSRPQTGWWPARPLRPSIGFDSVMNQDFIANVGNFSIDVYFAFLAGSGRQFNMVVRSDGAGQVNLRYIESVPGWQTFQIRCPVGRTII